MYLEQANLKPSVFVRSFPTGQQKHNEHAYLWAFDQKSINRRNFFSKRAFDVTFATLALLLVWPLLLIIILAIKSEDFGPTVFKQKRWGRGCKPFEVLKFRTMYLNRCDKGGSTQTTMNDPRVTVVGRFLRKTNLDELPQLVNVLRGEMSLVGPRCHPIKMFAGGKLYEDFVHNYHRRHAVLPGITGLAQVNGFRGPTICPHAAKRRIVYDRLYMLKGNIWLDCRIIAKTLAIELRGGTGS